jgi:hypothetical protein
MSRNYNLRDYARGQPCQVRLPCCNGGTETTVLAHVRLAGISGMGMKAPDLLGAWCCAACHVYCDTHKDDATQLAFAHGVFRTQAAMLKMGAIKIWCSG